MYEPAVMFGISYVKLKDEFDAETVFLLLDTCVPPVNGSKKLLHLIYHQLLIL